MTQFFPKTNPSYYIIGVEITNTLTRVSNSITNINFRCWQSINFRKMIKFLILLQSFFKFFLFQLYICTKKIDIEISYGIVLVTEKSFQYFSCQLLLYFRGTEI